MMGVSMESKKEVIKKFKQQMIDKYGSGAEKPLNNKLFKILQLKKISENVLRDVEEQLKINIDKR